MTWLLHYGDLIHHKIFKLLILSYFLNIIIWLGLKSIKNNIFIQNTRSLHTIFIATRYHLSINHQIHIHVTAQHHLSSHSINSPKTKKTSHLITGSLNSQDSPMNSQPKSLSPCFFKLSIYPLRFSLAASDSWNFSFKSPKSLCWSSIFSLCCWTLL